MEKSGPIRNMKIFAALAAILLAIACSLCFGAGTAEAKSYSVKKVVIQAEVMPNGDLHVVEQRRCIFNGQYHGMYWELGDIPSGSNVSVTGAQCSWNHDGTLQDIPELSYTQDIDSGNGYPGYQCWSLNPANNKMYVLFDAENADVSFQIDYTVSKAVQTYSDTSELYWNFIGKSWGVSAEQVYCEIKLPVPDGESVINNDSLNAYGHCAVGGTMKAGSDSSVIYTVRSLPPNQAATARIDFPTQWLSEPGTVHSEAHLQQVSEEESKAGYNMASGQDAEAYSSMLQRFCQMLGMIVLSIIIGSALGAGAKKYLTYKYKGNPKHISIKTHPLVAYAVANGTWNRFEVFLYAEILHLVDIGAYDGEADKNKFSLTKSDFAPELTDDIDINALNILTQCYGDKLDSKTMKHASIPDRREMISSMRNILINHVASQADKITDNDKDGAIIGKRERKNLFVAGVLLAVAVSVASFFYMPDFFFLAPIAFGLPFVLLSGMFRIGEVPTVYLKDWDAFVAELSENTEIDESTKAVYDVLENGTDALSSTTDASGVKNSTASPNEYNATRADSGSSCGYDPNIIWMLWWMTNSEIAVSPAAPQSDSSNNGSYSSSYSSGSSSDWSSSNDYSSSFGGGFDCGGGGFGGGGGAF